MEKYIDLSVVFCIKTVTDMTASLNPYLAKSVNLALIHMLFRSVYHDAGRD